MLSKVLDRFSIGFVALVLFFGLLIGSVLGSLVHQVFGFSWLDYALVPEGFAFIEDFYLIRRLELQITPGAILGFCVAAWYLYRAAKTTGTPPV